MNGKMNGRMNGRMGGRMGGYGIFIKALMHIHTQFTIDRYIKGRKKYEIFLF